jgi:hypothetical protein
MHRSTEHQLLILNQEIVTIKGEVRHIEQRLDEHGARIQGLNDGFRTELRELRSICRWIVGITLSLLVTAIAILGNALIKFI